MFAKKYSKLSSDPKILEGMPHTLYSEDGVFMVRAINICDWLDHTYGDDWAKHPSYKVCSKDMIAWCKKNNSYYYGQCREKFFMTEAINETILNEQDIVIYEDLS